MIVEEVEEIQTRIQDTQTRISEMKVKLVELNRTERVTAVKHPVQFNLVTNKWYIMQDSRLHVHIMDGRNLPRGNLVLKLRVG